MNCVGGGKVSVFTNDHVRNFPFKKENITERKWMRQNNQGNSLKSRMDTFRGCFYCQTISIM
jgi:hypothetical protein